MQDFFVNFNLITCKIYVHIFPLQYLHAYLKWEITGIAGIHAMPINLKSLHSDFPAESLQIPANICSVGIFFRVLAICGWPSILLQTYDYEWRKLYIRSPNHEKKEICTEKMKAIRFSEMIHFSFRAVNVSETSIYTSWCALSYYLFQEGHQGILMQLDRIRIPSSIDYTALP